MFGDFLGGISCLVIWYGASTILTNPSCKSFVYVLNWVLDWMVDWIICIDFLMTPLFECQNSRNSLALLMFLWSTLSIFSQSNVWFILWRRVTLGPCDFGSLLQMCILWFFSINGALSYLALPATQTVEPLCDVGNLWWDYSLCLIQDSFQSFSGCDAWWLGKSFCLVLFPGVFFDELLRWRWTCSYWMCCGGSWVLLL